MKSCTSFRLKSPILVKNGKKCVRACVFFCLISSTQARNYAQWHVTPTTSGQRGEEGQKNGACVGPFFGFCFFVTTRRLEMCLVPLRLCQAAGLHVPRCASLARSDCHFLSCSCLIFLSSSQCHPGQRVRHLHMRQLTIPSHSQRQ